MMEFACNDIVSINNNYKELLLNLKAFLKDNKEKSALSYSNNIISMLHRGLLSMNGTIIFDNDYEYIGLPSKISNGVHVMCGICCCRHATSFLYDFLCILDFNPVLMYVLVDNESNIWHKVDPSIEMANHIVISLNDKYILDPVNKFILEKGIKGELKLLDKKDFYKFIDYKDSNIDEIGKVLKKYYTYKELGIKNIYDYKL